MLLLHVDTELVHGLLFLFANFTRSGVGGCLTFFTEAMINVKLQFRLLRKLLAALVTKHRSFLYLQQIHFCLPRWT